MNDNSWINIKNKFSYQSLLLPEDDEDCFDKPCPEDNASLWQKLTFSWTQRMIWAGYFKAPLELQRDISDLPDPIKVETTTSYLDNIDYTSRYPIIKQIYKEFVTRNSTNVFIKLFSSVFSILSPICFKIFILYIGKPYEERSLPYGFLLCMIMFFSSFLFTYSQQVSFWYGLKISLSVRGSLTAKIFEKTLKLSNSSRREFTSGAIINLISVDVGCFGDFFWNNHIETFILPFQIIALLTLLFFIVGWSGLVGVIVMVISLPLCSYLSTRIAKNLRISLGYADKRCSLTSEFINGIRFLKLYAWERLFIDKIEEQRTQQLNYLYRRVVFWIVSKMITQITSALVLISTFTVYTLSGHVITLDVAFTSVLIFINLRRPLEMFPEGIHRLLSLIPSSKRIENFFQSSEIQKQPFAYKSKRTSSSSSSSSNTGRNGVDENNHHEYSNDIKIINGTFNWNESIFENSLSSQNDSNNSKKIKFDKLISPDSGNYKKVGDELTQQEEDNMIELMLLNDELQDKVNDPVNNVLNEINFTAPAGKLTIICGVVGSGKSSLVNGLIGEIYRVSGQIEMPSTVSFTTQQSFLISASVRENILFGKEMDMDRYKKVIQACSLTTDLLQFSALDLTQLGERGVNLSGGQKQRVSLARALYSNSDCYIMDEPLSAVDTEVASHLFDHCIQGMMAGKTRILITHQLQFIPSADHIVVLDNGQITQGTYQELKEKGIEFESIMKTKKLNVDQQTDTKDPTIIDDGTSLPSSPSTSELKKSIDMSKDIDINSIISDQHDSNLLEKAILQVKEDRNEGEVGLDIYKKYFKFGSSTFFFILTCSTYFLSQSIFQLSDFWLTIWTQDKMGKSNQFYIGYYVLFIGVFILFLMVRYFMLAHITFSSSKNLHNSLLKSVGYASCNFFDTNPSGRILNRFSKDISDIDLSLLENFSDVLYCGSTVIVSLCMMIYITPLIVAPFTVLVGVYYVIQKLYRSSSRELKRMESISRSPVFSLLAESYNGLVTIRTYQQESRFIKMMQNNININLRLFFYSFSVHRWIGIRLEFISSIVVLLCSFFSLFNSNTGLSVLSIATALSMTSYLNWAIRQWTELEVKMNSVERVLSYVDTPKEGTSIIDDESSMEIEVDSKWPSKGEIEFKNVEIRYRPTADPSLKNLTFKINSNEKIGWVGRTGSGKSTTMLALFRMVECSAGSILIDGIDIAKIPLQKLRSSLSLVPQDSFLFHGSILENIDPFNQYTIDQIWETLEKVKLSETIKSMPNGIETIVQENGDGLSYGQKQLLCLCRTILKNSKVVLLDESTSGIDYQTSHILKSVIQDNFSNCTMLTIAHRLDTIIDSDRIAVMDYGHLIEFDTPSNLIKTEGSIFKKLVKYQTDFYDSSMEKL